MIYADRPNHKVEFATVWASRGYDAGGLSYCSATARLDGASVVSAEDSRDVFLEVPHLADLEFEARVGSPWGHSQTGREPFGRASEVQLVLRDAWTSAGAEREGSFIAGAVRRPEVPCS